MDPLAHGGRLYESQLRATDRAAATSEPTRRDHQPGIASGLIACARRIEFGLARLYQKVPHVFAASPAGQASRTDTEIGTEAFGTDKEPGASRRELDITSGYYCM
jgi:hypothetical protein